MKQRSDTPRHKERNWSDLCPICKIYRLPEGEDYCHTCRQKCNICGESVMPGSGNFVNRIPDFNTPEVRKELGRMFPHGDYICASCDERADRMKEE